MKELLEFGNLGGSTLFGQLAYSELCCEMTFVSAAQETTTYVMNHPEPFPGPQVYEDPAQLDHALRRN